MNREGERPEIAARVLRETPFVLSSLSGMVLRTRWIRGSSLELALFAWRNVVFTIRNLTAAILL
jgi:hypothetical protein